MCARDRIIITMKPDLAYGVRERTGIPANSTLVFDYEILAVKPRSFARARAGRDCGRHGGRSHREGEGDAGSRELLRQPVKRPGGCECGESQGAGRQRKVLALGLTLLPDAYQLHQTLGRLQATRGDKAAAIKSYETALKLNPKKTAAEIRDHETATAALAVLR